MGQGDAGSSFSKGASGQPSDALLNDIILAHWVHCLIVVVEAPWNREGSLTVELW